MCLRRRVASPARSRAPPGHVAALAPGFGCRGPAVPRRPLPAARQPRLPGGGRNTWHRQRGDRRKIQIASPVIPAAVRVQIVSHRVTGTGNRRSQHDKSADPVCMIMHDRPETRVPACAADGTRQVRQDLAATGGDARSRHRREHARRRRPPVLLRRTEPTAGIGYAVTGAGHRYRCSACRFGALVPARPVTAGARMVR